MDVYVLYFIQPANILIANKINGRENNVLRRKS